jgi:transcriptional regulator with XRE-family HTH domain
MRDNVRDVRLRVGRNVRRLRLLRGLSQEDLAELVGNTNKHIGQVERGEVNVGIDTLTAIAQGCSVNVLDLFRSDLGGAKTKALILTRRDLDHVEESLRIVARAKSARRRRKQKTPD